MSIFKRLFGEKDDNNTSGQVFKAHVNNNNIKSMGSNLQKRFSRGIQYNMKIVIRGDRNVGKSALLARLKGMDFCEQYIPTDEIEVASIHWNYKSNDDVVKVEVWDVVDKGRKKKPSGLKFENISAVEDKNKSLCLDAEFLDVYKGAHAVIMVLDITKSWTLNYVERELQCVPDNIPILVLANHRDMGAHRTVTTDQVQTLVESMPSFDKGMIKYWECSMKNGFGLIYIHRFFNIPFLQLQRDTLLKQLATNDKDMSCALQELEDLEEEPESIYENFITNLKQTKTILSHNQKPNSLEIHSNPVSQINSPVTSVSNSNGVQHKTSLTPMTECASNIADSRSIVIHPPQARPIPGMDKLGLYPLPVPNDNQHHYIVSNNEGEKENIKLEEHSNKQDKRNIDEFIPEEHPELSSFLDDVTTMTSNRSSNGVTVDSNHRHSSSLSSSSDDHDTQSSSPTKLVKRSHNPMVATFQDDIDLDDVTIVDNNVTTSNNSVSFCTFNNGTFSSDDDLDNKLTFNVSSNASIRHNDHSISNQSQNELHHHLSSVVIGSHGNNSENNNIIDNNNNKYATSSDIVHADNLYLRNEFYKEQLSINTNSSVTKKKKKKHHKDSENKDSELRKKKKKKTKVKSEDNSSIDIVSKVSPETKKKSGKISKKSDNNDAINIVQGSELSIVRTDRSDSLERFLND